MVSFFTSLKTQEKENKYPSSGGFEVFFIPLEERKTEKEGHFSKKIPFSAIIFLFFAAICVHGYLFFEKHLLKTLVAPGIILITSGLGKLAMAEEKSQKEDKPPPKEDKKENASEKQGKEQSPSKKDEKKDENAPFDPLSLNESRIKVLLSLSEKEKDIKNREEMLVSRENIAKSMEKEVEKRSKDLEELKKVIESLAKDNNEYAQKNLKRLVDIYEAMKPPAAAKIFNDLPQSVLQSIVKLMNQKKASAVLAIMDQDKVRALTNALAVLPQVPEKDKQAPKK